MYFTFKDINSQEMGVTLLKPPLTKSPDYRRYTQEIPGRHGADVKTGGLTSHTYTLDIAVEEERALEVLGWLKGRGLFSYYHEPNKYLEADIQAEVALQYHSPGIYLTTLNVYAHDATWFKKGAYTVEPLADVVVNEGTFNAKPKLKLYKGSTDIADVTIGDTRFIYDFKGEDHVTIDCEHMEAYRNETKRNHRLTIGYKFPILLPGENQIITNVKIDFERKDRWL